MYTEDFKMPFDMYGKNATDVVKGISSLDGSVIFVKEEKEMNAKSLLGILSLGLRCEDIITIKTSKEESLKNVKEILFKIVG